MSRFFAGAGSSSEEEEALSDRELHAKKTQQRKFMADSGASDSSESDFDEDVRGEGDEEDGDDIAETADTQREKDLDARRSRFLIGSDSDSDDDEDVQRVVKSQKDKLLEEVSEISEAIGDAIDVNKWSTVAIDFDRLVKAAGKAVRFGPLPESFFDFADFLGDVISEKTGEQVKKLSSDEGRSFNTFKHKYKKTDFEALKSAAPAGEAVEEAKAVDMEQRTREISLDDITAASIPHRVQEILGSRGKRRATSERSENVVVLRRCLQVANTPELRSQVLVAMLSTAMDTASGTMSIDQLAGLLENLSLLGTELSRCSLPAKTDSEMSTLNFAVSHSALLQRCNDELSLAMNGCDHHSPAYLDLAKVELQLIDQLRAAISALSRFGLGESVLECQARLLDRIYYRPSTAAAECKALLLALYRSGNEVLQARALLTHSYVLLLKGRFGEAKQLVVSSGIQDHVSRFPVALQILFNRVLVHLGLAAFRLGHLPEAYFYLHEICASGRPKELVGQGLSYHQGHSSRHLERSERLRLVPHHCNLNIELMDTVFSIASMLLELPQAAAQHSGIHSPIPRRVFQSRHLKRILDSYERSLFNGPPENSRETIMAACRAMIHGDWRSCVDLLCDEIKVWGQLDVRKLLGEKVRRSTMLLSIYTMASSLSTLSVKQLSHQFDLDPRVVKDCLSAHPMLVPDERSEVYRWRESKQLRQDHMDRTMAHLRELALPECSGDKAACEYIVFGRSLHVPVESE